MSCKCVLCFTVEWGFRLNWFSSVWVVMCYVFVVVCVWMWMAFGTVLLYSFVWSVLPRPFAASSLQVDRSSIIHDVQLPVRSTVCQPFVNHRWQSLSFQNKHITSNEQHRGTRSSSLIYNTSTTNRLPKTLFLETLAGLLRQTETFIWSMDAKIN